LSSVRHIKCPNFILFFLSFFLFCQLIVFRSAGHCSLNVYQVCRSMASLPSSGDRLATPRATLQCTSISRKSRCVFLAWLNTYHYSWGITKAATSPIISGDDATSKSQTSILNLASRSPLQSSEKSRYAGFQVGFRFCETYSDLNSNATSSATILYKFTRVVTSKHSKHRERTCALPESLHDKVGIRLSKNAIFCSQGNTLEVEAHLVALSAFLRFSCDDDGSVSFPRSFAIVSIRTIVM
jgi:hypothetical protein